MSLVDHEGTVEYPFSQKTVFKAIMEAAPNIEGLSVDSADEMSGRVTFKAGVSLASWGENIPVQLVRIAPTRTQMKVLSTPKTGVMFGGAMDFGKNRRNIEKIMSAVSTVLSAKPSEKEISLNTSSDVDKLVKLKDLLDSKVITLEEFNEQKNRLLHQDQADRLDSGETSLESEQLDEPILIKSEGEDNTVTYVAVAVGIVILLWIFLALV